MTPADDAYADLPAVLDVPGAAEVLVCGERAVRNLIECGDLGSVRLGRLIRIPRHCLIEYLTKSDGPATNGTTAANATPPPQQEARHAG